MVVSPIVAVEKLTLIGESIEMFLNTQDRLWDTRSTSSIVYSPHLAILSV
jgi:hypothetical protein